MIRFMKPLTAVLAVSFRPTAVYGQTSCLNGPRRRCTFGSANVGLAFCTIATADIPALKDCFDFIGRDNIVNLLLNNNRLSQIPADLFANLTSLESLSLGVNSIATIEVGAFTDLSSLRVLRLDSNSLTAVPAGVFSNLPSLETLYFDENSIQTIAIGAFEGLGSLQFMDLSYNNMATIEAFDFEGLEALEELNLHQNAIQTIAMGAFKDLGSLQFMDLGDNSMATIEPFFFEGLEALKILILDSNGLNRLPVDAFTGLSALEDLNLEGNPGLQCVPTNSAEDLSLPPNVGTECGCTPAEAVSCDTGETCAAGAVGFTCIVAVACTQDSECDTNSGEVCCPKTNVCEDPTNVDAGACGDPHMTGFRGQKFDFTGVDYGWYAVVSDLPHMHLNMRVTSPVPSVPEITYITGISIVAKDADGFDHTIVISVADPHNLESSCPVGTSPCLADGALLVVVNGDEVLMSPGEVTVAPGVAIAAVNLPGACRSFGFEKYWEAKKLERLAQAGRKLRLTKTMRNMSDWILSDPTATYIPECEEYVASATAVSGVGLFAKQSEHASFQIMTPAATIRLSHGRLHQLPMRDPSDQFDLPDHLAWQMNMAIDYSNMGLDTTGILGETLVPTVDDNGDPIMQGMDAIRGKQEDYRVKGPLGVTFSQSQHHE